MLEHMGLEAGTALGIWQFRGYSVSPAESQIVSVPAIPAGRERAQVLPHPGAAARAESCGSRPPAAPCSRCSLCPYVIKIENSHVSSPIAVSDPCVLPLS